MRRPKTEVYRPIFEDANGLGPWRCYGCGESVDANELLIHHLDEDPFNNDPTNLVAMHRSCHFSLHKLGKPHSPEHRESITRACANRRQTQATRDKISTSTRGVPKMQPRTSKCGSCDLVSTTRGIQLHQRGNEHRGVISL